MSLILLALLAILSLGLMITAFTFHKAYLAMAACLMWLITGAQSYISSDQIWDVYYFLFFACIGLFFTSAFEAAELREKSEEPEETQFSEEIDQAYKDMDARLTTMRNNREKGL